MTRLYSNENFPFPVVSALRRLGHDVVTVQETGRANQEIPDDQVLAFAHTHRRAVLTINRKDFRLLHKQSSNHSGIIICTADLDFSGQAQRIHAALISYPSLAGELIRVNRG